MNRRDSAAKRGQVAILIASGRSIVEAAQECGVGERTMHTWLGDPEFRAELERIRSEHFSRVADYLAAQQLKAAKRLDALSDSQRESIAIMASKAVLDHSMLLRRVIAFESRLADLERRSGFGTVG